MQVLAGHNNRVWHVAFSPAGNLVTSSSYNQTIRLWNVSSGKTLHILHGHKGWVWCVVFSPDGATMASSSADTTIKLWEVKTGRCLKTLQTKGPYDDLNITNVTGITPAQKTALKALGAVEKELNMPP